MSFLKTVPTNAAITTLVVVVVVVLVVVLAKTVLLVVALRYVNNSFIIIPKKKSTYFSISTMKRRKGKGYSKCKLISLNHVIFWFFFQYIKKKRGNCEMQGCICSPFFFDASQIKRNVQKSLKENRLFMMIFIHQKALFFSYITNTCYISFYSAQVV